MDNYDFKNLLSENFDPKQTPRPGGVRSAAPVTDDKGMQEIWKIVRQQAETIKAQAQQLAEISERLANPLKQEWMTADMVCDVLDISVRTLQTLRDNGNLPYSGLNGKFIYKTKDVEGFLKNNYKVKRAKTKEQSAYL